MGSIFNLRAALKLSEERLNRAVTEYQAASGDAKEFYRLKVQSAIFTYDLTAAVAAYALNQGSGFAAYVALKALVHTLYEYHEQLTRRLVARIMRYAALRNKPIERDALKAVRDRWRAKLAPLRAWKEIRDVATGHYDDDIDMQIALLPTVDESDVFNVFDALVGYNHDLFLLLPHSKRKAV